MLPAIFALTPQPKAELAGEKPDHNNRYQANTVSTRQPVVKSMALKIELPGHRSNSSKTLPDRTVATLAPLQNDTRSDMPSDPRRDQQWSFFETRHYKGASALFAARAHNSGNFPVVVGVVDSGVMLGHEDLELLPGYDFVSDNRVANDGDGRDADPSDPGDWVTAEEIAVDPVAGCTATRSKWHGTAVSGTIGAISDNQRGITGGAPSVLLLPVRVTGKCGGYIKDLVDGVRWAAGLPVDGAPANDYPARIINLSVGFSGSCPASLQNAIDGAVASGAAVVVAATNSAATLDNEPQSPASCTNVTTVGALLRNGSLAPYSAIGSALAVLAAGGSANDGIITTQNASDSAPDDKSSYGYHFGTSMAAAHVSATFATLLSIDPSLTNQSLQQLVRQSATDADNINGCPHNMCGAGRLNAKGAVDLLISGGADQLQNDPPANDSLTVSTESSAIPPSTAAANEESPAARPATGGAGQTDRAGIAWLLCLAVIGRWRKRLFQPSSTASH